jgi:hypothetical protein
MMQFLGGLLVGYFVGGFAVGMVMLLGCRVARRRRSAPDTTPAYLRLPDAGAPVAGKDAVSSVTDLPHYRRPR